MKNHNTLKGKTILLVNTGNRKKRFIIQRLKKLDLNLVALNKEKNWAQPYVDHWIIANTYNHDESIRAVQNFFKSNPEIKTDGILTFWEDDVLLTSKLVDKFGFIGIPLEIAKQARNKYLFREFCKNNGINTPQHLMIKNSSELKKVCHKLKFPMVIKPAYGSSSAYVVRVNNKEELRDTYHYIRKNISAESESALSDGLDIFVEEFLDGDEVDIDILLQNGKIKFYSIADNFDKSKEQFFVDSGQAMPSTLPEKNQKELINMAEDALEKLGIQNGCIHFEAKSTPSGPFPIEVNLRMGGDYVYSYNKSAWNIDLIEYAAKIAIGQLVKIKPVASPRRYIIGWDLHPESSGLLVELNVEEELKKKKYFEEMNIYKEVGDPILLPPEGYESLGWLTVAGDNFLDAQDNLKDALTFIQYKVSEFDEESSLGKTSRKNSLAAAVLKKDLLMKTAKLKKIQRLPLQNQRRLYIGIATNISKYDESNHKPEETAHHIEKTLQERGYNTAILDFNNLNETLYQLRQGYIDLVFNVSEGVEEDLTMRPQATALLEALHIPYTGASSVNLSLSYDRIRFKKILNFHNIPTPKWDYAYTLDDQINPELQYPLIIKPSEAGSTFGVTEDSVVENKEHLDRELRKILVQMGMPALVEEYIEGEEYEVSILGANKDDLKVLPLARSLFHKMPANYWHIYAKTNKNSKCQAYKKIILQSPLKNVSKKLESLLTEIALDAYQIMQCRDYGRVEIRVDQDDNPYVLRVNPNPKLSPDSQLTKTAGLTGLNFGDLLEEIISLTIKRYRA